MFTVRTSDAVWRGEFTWRFSSLFRDPFWSLVLVVILGLGCDRLSPLARAEALKASAREAPSEATRTPDLRAAGSAKDRKKKRYDRQGYAVWYVVPANSLARRRAGKDEFTAAHNYLPLRTMIRVTHLGNGRSVIVRITDRGITKRGATIDLCKPAAEKLGILREGIARVRMEEVPDESRMDADPNPKRTAAHP